MHPLRVTMVANDLGISEYDLFVLAHRAYFGTEPKASDIETQFGAWMMGELKLPFYVQYFLDNGILSA